MGHKSFSIRPFEKLKKKIVRKETISLSPPALPRKKDSFTDEELFCTAMDDVQEIEEFRKLSITQGQKKAAPSRGKTDSEREALTILCEIAEGRRPINLPDTQEYVEWTNPAYLGDLTQMLHEGQFSIQSFLDLHGYTVPEAEAKMEDFFKESLLRGLRCVKIIHGRGLRSVKGPQIKGAVIRRLSGHYRRDVIAYVTARQCDGGLGALYVLLRENNPGKRS
jgi:DNA-nicking Smr family endonuclease